MEIVGVTQIWGRLVKFRREMGKPLLEIVFLGGERNGRLMYLSPRV